MEVRFPPIAVKEYHAVLRSVMTSAFDLQQAVMEHRVSPEITLPPDITRHLTKIFLDVFMQLDVAIYQGLDELELVLDADPAELPGLADAFLALSRYKEELAAAGVISDVDWSSFGLVQELAGAARIDIPAAS